ncbi:MAG: bifunctional demethylmenaquinone methyltransferase/2-methoxy-6-polyprenyl-1,4-benzoquinol methylase UbiE [Muribaculaceae bacterium]|nr:bifunctional demethylmenaquinone methyltransferase/2-methoxy-6-polyprenyl-1,4-benzoquinol methylase UbiE [Muribaculaceae bacterium]
MISSKSSETPGNNDATEVPATADVESVNPYDSARHKAAQVEEMFDSIAPAYDFMNNAMTFGMHRAWRNAAIRAAVKARQSLPTRRILDIATGTGDVAFKLNEVFPDVDIIGIDLSSGMLEIADKKLKNSDESVKNKIKFEQGDSLSLRFDDNSFDLVTVAYGVRNFEHLSLGLREMARVLRSGGTLCIIELSCPANRFILPLYNLYSRKLIPLVGKLVSGDSRAYTYLPESIAAAPQRERLARMMTDAGFSNCHWKSLTFGVVTYYIATK